MHAKVSVKCRLLKSFKIQMRGNERERERRKGCNWTNIGASAGCCYRCFGSVFSQSRNRHLRGWTNQTKEEELFLIKSIIKALGVLVLNVMDKWKGSLTVPVAVEISHHHKSHRSEWTMRQWEDFFCFTDRASWEEGEVFYFFRGTSTVRCILFIFNWVMEAFLYFTKQPGLLFSVNTSTTFLFDS